MRGAERVCAAWRRGAVCEPALWRRVDLTTVPARWQAMALAAVDRAAGHCQAYRGPCDSQLLLYFVERATSLKSIHLTHDDPLDVSLDVKQLNTLPLLEDVYVSLSYYSNDASQNLLQSTCQAFPHLKELRMSFSMNRGSNYYEYYLDGLDQNYKIPKMRELRSLELLGSYLTAAGLKAILDTCPALESLNVPTGDNWISSTMDSELRAKCPKLKNLTLPCDSDEDYYEGDDPEEDYELDTYGYFY